MNTREQLDDRDDRIGARLRILDLRLVTGTAHLSEERLALIVSGESFDEAEAEHLSACDECLDCLRVLGEGLELLGEQDAAAAAWTPSRKEPVSSPPLAEPGPLAPTPPARGRRVASAGVVLSLLGAFAALAAGGYLAWAPESAAPAPVVAPRPQRKLLSPPVSPAPPSVAIAAPASAAEVAPVPPVLPEVVAPDVAPHAEPEAPTPARVAEAPTPRRAPGSRPTRPAVPAAVFPDAETEARGPRRLESQPLSGPPRGYGLLRLNAKPPAEVIIDGRSRGWTPLVDLRLQEGAHDVVLRYEHPAAAVPEERFRVLIEADQTWKTHRVNLKR